ncbi:hypothetical protein BLOT_016081, partial [Blomia tropicalis]
MGTPINSDNLNGIKNWELSLYELNRKPQDIIDDFTEIAISPRSLHSELMCPICLDMLNQTMATKECLHRFCQECIITALRSGNKECPTCRKKLVSKRCLRPDPNFDDLIKRIYPNREEYESHQEKVIAKVNHNKFMENVEQSFRLQTLNRTRPSNKRAAQEDERSGKPKPVNPPSDESDNENLPENDSYVPELELVIKPLPRDPSTKVIRFIKTAVTATIDHIAKYLQIRHNMENGNCDKEIGNGIADNNNWPYTIYAAGGPGQYNPIRGSMTLSQVCEQYWKHQSPNRPLQLFYAYKMNGNDATNLVGNGNGSSTSSGTQIGKNVKS